MVRSISRAKKVWERMGVRRSTFYDIYAPLRTRIKLGRRAIGFIDDEVDALVDRLIAGNLPPKPKRKASPAKPQLRIKPGASS
jgi:predicted DNA-binding transcriptional regulator AlpA